ncbi:uncharacterized protein C15orf41 homolog isoform X3 [Dendronephthya gigantea]|uniref:uncharacterized protein C15orf41 homolog isoform X3 n=1 Tax=Dendronephthya gigantea TaxID=151771 RepID=UPI00106B93C0|nr:uncharacterized protein C15orf41 homolog isoform X3 [Dendronephthya gigantea]
MKLEVYREIVSIIHSCWTRECFKTISAKFSGVTNDALISIYSQEFQKKIKKNHHKHHQPDVVESYYKRYLELIHNNKNDSILLSMAQEIDLSPCILARIILEEYLYRKYCKESHVPKDVISHMIKDPSLIPCEELSHEIQQCVLKDENCGPLVDNIKHSIGIKYENLLEEKLAEWKIPFLGEKDMRCQGYDKTPDFKLQVPIDGHVVNWIESKASFGDESSHKTYLKDQFWSYWNRFGPGMVIYWFGFIDELDCNRDKGIILCNSFPCNLVTLTSLVWKDDCKKT